jgi:acyl-CoA thioesterase-1
MSHWISIRYRFLLALAVVALAMPLAREGACAQANAPVLLVVGDSISAGYGLSTGQGWVDHLATRLSREGYPQRVVNASISGDTTAGGRARLPTLLREHKPAIVILELGGNDALRGGDLNATRANLDAMIAASQSAGAKVLVLGMQLPPNYGPAYVKRFNALFTESAAAHKAAIVPYLFDTFGEDLSQFQADRIHPTAAAQDRIVTNVWPALKPLLGK